MRLNCLTVSMLQYPRLTSRSRCCFPRQSRKARRVFLLLYLFQSPIHLHLQLLPPLSAAQTMRQVMLKKGLLTTRLLPWKRMERRKPVLVRLPLSQFQPRHPPYPLPFRAKPQLQTLLNYRLSHLSHQYQHRPHHSPNPKTKINLLSQHPFRHLFHRVARMHHYRNPLFHRHLPLQQDDGTACVPLHRHHFLLQIP